MPNLVQGEKMKNVPVKDLVDGHYFTDEVLLDANYVLLSQETPISKILIKALLDWEFRTVYSNGMQVSAYTEKKEFTITPDIEAEQEKEDSQKKVSQYYDDKDLIEIQQTYNEYFSFIDQVFSHFMRKNDLGIQEISNKVRDLCDFIKENKKQVLRLSPSPDVQEKNYLVSHSLKTTVLSIVIGLQLKFPSHKLIELGVAALLHEIGMLKLPPQVYMSNRSLTPQEKNAIFAHPVLTYKILRDFSFPLNICLAGLEHHERMNGTGYPRKVPGDKISIYARIISVACSYEAATSYRPYKSAVDTYHGIIEIMKNVGKQYDDSIIRALVFSISLYPIGLYVLLSNEERGQVIDVNPLNPKYPIVKVFNSLNVSGGTKTIQTSEKTVFIVRPLTKEEGEILKASKK